MLREIIAKVDRWTEKEQTQAEVKSLILDQASCGLSWLTRSRSRSFLRGHFVGQLGFAWLARNVS